MPQPEDAALVQACLDGRPEAWEALVDRFAPYLAGVARSTLAAFRRPAGPADVADVLQEVFLRLLEQDRKALKAYQGQGSLAGYLAAIAVSRIRDRKPWPHRKLPVAEPVSEAPDPLEHAEDLSRLKAELSRLPPETRLALALQARGASLREVGRVLGLSEDGAAQLVSRARSALREKLE